MSRKNLNAILCIGVLAAVFLGGVLFHKYKPFPYERLSRIAKQARKVARVPDEKPAEAIKNQYTRDSGDAELAKDVDTALLPIRMTGIRVGSRHDIPKTAGGIAVVHDVIVVVDRLGNVHAYENGNLRKLAFPDLPNNITAFVSDSNSSLTPGTLRVHDAEYLASSATLAVSHEFFDLKSKATRLVVSTIRIDALTMKSLGQWQRLFTGDLVKVATYAGLAGGGRLVAKPPDKLLLTTGDYNQDNVMLEGPKVAQISGSSLGKIIEINIAERTHETLSRGHRNPQGLVVAENGEIYSTEHGPAGGDELNHIKAGANYGWPEVSLGVDYGTYRWPNAEFSGEHGGYALPMFAWIPSIGVSNLIQIRRFHRTWDGDFLVASLKASSLFRLRLVENRVLYSEPIWVGERIRDLAQLKDGTIVLWTDDAQLLFLSVDHKKLNENKRALDITAPPIMVMCMTCHHFGPTNPSHPGPTLSNLIGKRIASDSFSKYSTALRERGGVWTEQSLRAFISKPNEFANGTLMPKPEISETDIENIVAHLVKPTN